MTVGMLVLIIINVLLLQVSVVVLVGLYRRKRQYREIDARASKPQTLSGSQELIPSSTDAPSAQAACHAGSCGCCQTKVEAGEVEYSQMPTWSKVTACYVYQRLRATLHWPLRE